VYVPVSAGGLSFMYNLIDGSGNRVNDLKLTRRTSCKIFTGAIKKWNDPELVQDNPQLAGFNRDIVPVIRADAGQKLVFSQFCIAVARRVGCVRGRTDSFDPQT
jgi:ABC-type phosphate transport system substrate-binding protein